MLFLLADFKKIQFVLGDPITFYFKGKISSYKIFSKNSAKKHKIKIRGAQLYKYWCGFTTSPPGHHFLSIIAYNFVTNFQAKSNLSRYLYINNCKFVTSEQIFKI